MLQSNSLSPAVPAFEPSSAPGAVPVEATAPAGVEPPQPAQPVDAAESPGGAVNVEVAQPETVAVSDTPLATSEPASADRPDLPIDLDNRQRLALVSLARGSSMKQASHDAGVGRTTLYRWINEDARFRAAYNRWKADTQLSAHGQVLALQDLAAEVLREQLQFKRDARLAAHILEKTGALAPPTIGPTHPGRAAAHIIAEQREQDAQAAERVKDADRAFDRLPDKFRFAENAAKGK